MIRRLRTIVGLALLGLALRWSLQANRRRLERIVSRLARWAETSILEADRFIRPAQWGEALAAPDHRVRLRIGPLTLAETRDAQARERDELVAWAETVASGSRRQDEMATCNDAAIALPLHQHPRAGGP